MPSRSPANALSDVCGVVVCAIGASVLLMGTNRADWLRGLIADGPTIRPATAACLIVLGVLLISVRRINTDRFTGPARVVLSGALAVASAGAAWRLMRLVDRVGEAPRPISPHTVTALFLLGLATLVAIRADERRRQLAIVLALGGAVAPWLALLGYTTGTPMFFAVPHDPATGMAVTAAAALLIVSVGVMGLFPDHGFVALFTMRSEGGTLMRVLLPAAVLFPLVVGGVFGHGQRVGWFSREESLSLTLGVTSAVITALVLWIGMIFKRREAEKDAAEAEREHLLASLRTSLDELNKLQNNLVTVCAWTQRVLDEGKWVRFEEFLDKRLNISITHGISEDAANDELQSLEDWMNQSAPDDSFAPRKPPGA